jgi:hypothetical protein
MGKECSTHEAKLNASSDLLERPNGKRPLGKPRRRREDNIKVDHRDIGWDIMD